MAINVNQSITSSMGQYFYEKRMVAEVDLKYEWVPEEMLNQNVDLQE